MKRDLPSNLPKDRWSISRGGILLSRTSVLHPGDAEYRAVVVTLCGREEATVDVQCVAVMAAAEFARRVRLLASIQHWLQNACADCGERLRLETTPAEKSWVNCTDPTLGAILGFEPRIVGPGET